MDGKLMTINRRQFLQMLGVAGAAAVLPIELTGSAIQSAGTAFDATLDAPVTKANPLAWLIINGREIPVISVGITRKMIDVTTTLDAWRQYIPGNRIDINFTTPFDAENFDVLSCEEVDFSMRVDGITRMSGKGCILGISSTVSHRNYGTTDVSMTTTGPMTWSKI
jgi:hypothetical protein